MSSTESQNVSSKVSSQPQPSPAVEQNPASYRLPDDSTLQHAARFALVEDKPIMLDYWTASLDKKAVIGVRDTKEKLLVKSSDEYTSPISKIYKNSNEFIVFTENSIYIVANEIPTKRIS